MGRPDTETKELGWYYLNAMPMSEYFAERFPALQIQDFRRLWMANSFSNAGSMMQNAALHWQIYDLTGSPLALGAMGIVRVLPIICFSLLAGTIADQSDRRKLLILTQSVMALIAITLGVLTLTHHISVAGIYILSACGAAATAFNNPAYQALVPNLVGRERLQSAITLGSTGFQAATVIGPAMAGVVIGRLGTGWAYIINATTFIAPLIALALLTYRPEPRNPSEERPGFLESLKEGIAFVRSTPILWSTMSLDFVATFFASANSLLPVFARDILHVGAEGYGWLSAAPSVGSLTTAIALNFLPPIKNSGRALLWAVAGFGCATIGFGFVTTFAMAFIFLALTGATDMVSAVLRNTLRQMVTPDRMRGRMVSISMVFFMGGPQLGELEAGAVAKWFGPLFSVVSGGVATVLYTAYVAAAQPHLRRFRMEDHKMPD